MAQFQMQAPNSLPVASIASQLAAQQQRQQGGQHKSKAGNHSQPTTPRRPDKRRLNTPQSCSGKLQEHNNNTSECVHR